MRTQDYPLRRLFCPDPRFQCPFVFFCHDQCIGWFPHVFIVTQPGVIGKLLLLHYTSILRNDLLIALGALLMGSKRGSVTEVLNVNCDDVLNWYLALHGFDTQVVTRLPSLQ